MIPDRIHHLRSALRTGIWQELAVWHSRKIVQQEGRIGRKGEVAYGSIGYTPIHAHANIVQIPDIVVAVNADFVREAELKIRRKEFCVRYRNHHLPEGLHIAAGHRPHSLPPPTLAVKEEHERILYFRREAAALRLVEEREINAVARDVST